MARSIKYLVYWGGCKNEDSLPPVYVTRRLCGSHMGPEGFNDNEKEGKRDVGGGVNLTEKVLFYTSSESEDSPLELSVSSSEIFLRLKLGTCPGCRHCGP